MANQLDESMVTHKKNALCIALTGGIGSGKTTVANFFSELGVPIVDADAIALSLTQPDQPAFQTIVNHFGESFLNVDRTLNRRKLRDLIFQDETEKEWLEKLLHPMIRQEMRAQIHAINAPYCICIIPLLAESKGSDFIDRVLVVESPLEQQVKRVTKRDQSNASSVQKIISAQATEQERRAIADDILLNDGDIESLENKVLALHQQYCKLTGG